MFSFRCFLFYVLMCWPSDGAHQPRSARQCRVTAGFTNLAGSEASHLGSPASHFAHRPIPRPAAGDRCRHSPHPRTARGEMPSPSALPRHGEVRAAPPRSPCARRFVPVHPCVRAPSVFLLTGTLSLSDVTAIVLPAGFVGFPIRQCACPHRPVREGMGKSRSGCGACALAIAHHADDQPVTLLLPL